MSLISPQNDSVSGWRGATPGRRKAERRTLRSDPSQEYLFYTPGIGAACAPVVVAVLGLSDNSHDQAKQLVSHCERYGAVLVAPKFTARKHPNFQRLGRSRGVRSDHLLEIMIDEVAALTGANCGQVYLFGFSAGAQFAHRYMMARPHRVARAVIAAAGWYTFPDASQRYPYGIRPTRNLSDTTFDPEEFLRVPTVVLVGERDIQNNRLRHAERIEAQQGQNRVERAKRWVTAMREAAEQFGFTPCVELRLVPGVNHSFTHFATRGNIADVMFENFFERRTANEPNGASDEAST